MQYKYPTVGSVIIPLYLHYLVRTRWWRGDVSNNTTSGISLTGGIRAEEAGLSLESIKEQ